MNGNERANGELSADERLTGSESPENISRSRGNKVDLSPIEASGYLLSNATQGTENGCSYVKFTLVVSDEENLGESSPARIHCLLLDKQAYERVGDYTQGLKVHVKGTPIITKFRRELNPGKYLVIEQMEPFA